MKKIIFCLSAIISLLIVFSISSFAQVEFTEAEAKKLETVSNFNVCDSLGDCDGNGKVSLSDARKALRAAIGLESLSESQTERADIDGDDSLSVTDARTILRIVVGSEEQTGHKTVTLNIVPATCSTKGYSIKYCTVCQKKTSEWTKYDKNTHLGGWVTTKEATCKTNGLKQYKCQLCDKVLKEKTITKSNKYHQYTDWVYPNGNDCTVITERYRTCKVCKLKQDDTRTPRNSHYMTVKAKAATCTEDGLWKCQYCDKTEVIKATGHLYNSTEYTVYKQATCTETGLKAQLCVNCKTPRENTITTIPALGHSYDYSKQKVITEPTCKATGKAKVYCKTCGKAYTYTLKKTDHVLTKDWAVTKAAKCTTTGIKTAKCKYCGTLSQTIPATGHSGEWKITKAATCTAEGTKTWACKNCSYVKTESIAKIAHSGEWKVTKAATCTEDGIKTFACVNCDYKITEVINKLGHTYTTVIKQGYYCNIIKEPNCTEQGQAELRCKTCGEKETVTLAIDPDNHVLADKDRIVSEATCQQGAKYYLYCTLCDKNVTPHGTGRKVDHKASEEWIITEAPTCTKAGSKETHCIYCNVLMQTETIEATGHINTTSTKGTYNINGTCKVTEVCNDCGETVNESTFTKIVVTGGTVVFETDSTTTFEPGDIIKFTITESNVTGVDVNSKPISEENGIYQYTIPEDTADDDIITFRIYSEYVEEE